MVGTHTAQEDPGWPKGLGRLAAMSGFGRMASRAGRDGGQPVVLQLRLILLTVWQALALLAVVLFFAVPGTAGGADEPIVWILLGIGAVSAIGGASYVRRRPLACDAPEALVAQYRTTFFVGIALVESAALFGFVASFLVSAVWPYLVALVPTAIGFALFTPTRSRLEAVDRELQASGCQHSLRAGLYGGGDGTGDRAS